MGGMGGRGARPSGWRGCAPRLMALALESGLAWAWVVAPVRSGGIGVWHEQWRTPRQWRGRTAWRWRAALVLALERRRHVAWVGGLREAWAGGVGGRPGGERGWARG